MSGANWADLRPRLASGLAMLAVGAFSIWWGGRVFALLAIVVTGLMVWELAAMIRSGSGPGSDSGARPLAMMPEVALEVVLGLLAAAVLALVVLSRQPLALPLLALPALVGPVLLRRARLVFGAYALAVMLAGYGLVALRMGAGAGVILWIVSVVVVSDVAGYFAGRALGGPKFWPRVSPKKTWSGTVAGWLGAVLVGAGFALSGWGGWGLVALSPLVAFAGQMGDIAESAIKRQMGVKDSSHLIPGHGGVLDRFDALIGAVLVVLVLFPLLAHPFGGV